MHDIPQQGEIQRVNTQQKKSDPEPTGNGIIPFRTFTNIATTEPKKGISKFQAHNSTCFVEYQRIQLSEFPNMERNHNEINR